MDTLPRGFALSTLLYIHPEADANATSSGRPPAINAAMGGWGRLLRLTYHRADARRAALRAGDVTAEFLSYYTDNGAYYYYQGEGNKVRRRTRVIYIV